MAASQPALRSSQPHIHVAGLKCPVCEQAIPNEKADQVRERIEARDRALSESVSLKLKEQFALERVQIEANGRTALEQVKSENVAAIAAVREEALRKEAAAREEGSKAAQTAAQEKLDAMAKANATLQADATAKIAEIQQAKVAAELAAQERIAAAERARVVAENLAKSAKENHETLMNERLQEQREALEKDKTAAVLAEQAKTFQERQKLQSSVQNLQQQLERERADVLGEGAERELFEELKAAFEGDRIRRVPKGTAGADIIHEIVENGKVYGKIVYDSKKRTTWRTEYATKLCEDKVAEGAQHAVLALLKFPADAKQLDVRDGVILANPARVTAIAEILRDHVVQTHGLRMSNQERERKQGALYAYIMSERFQQHLDSIESQTGKLLDLDVDEQKSHRSVWEKRGKLLKAVEKAQGNLRVDIGRIVGTDTTAE
jgi:hypothetical protein